MNRKTVIFVGTQIVLGLACASAPAFAKSDSPTLATEVVEHAHRGDDDLLTAGLGAAGLRSPVPPAFADATHPTAAERRRRAIWVNWRGIADLAPGGAYGELYGSLQAVPGREYHALAKLPGARQAHRVMVQLPDTYDIGKRCLVVTASSGSRGIYGAIALAGAWGLSHGCAVAYTDKGNGTGFVDTATGQGTRIDGSPAGAADVAEFTAGAFTGAGVAPIAVKHAHSGDNPEADWGRHVRQAAQFGLQVLQAAHPEAGPHSFANTRVIAVGVSNGGGAVLRAAELDGAWLDGVVAVSPNIHVPDRGRALFDYTTDAAVWMPCALNAPAFDRVALARPGGAKPAAGQVRCASLKTAGLLAADTADAQAEQAHQHLLAGGWTDAAIAAGAISSGFDLWRAVAVTYASAYSRTDAANMPCGYRFNAVDAKGVARAPSAVERAAWWSDSAGIPPGAGVAIVDSLAAGGDPSLPGLSCLRGLLSGTDATARAAAPGPDGNPRVAAAEETAGPGDPWCRRWPGAGGIQRRGVRTLGQGRRARRALLARGECPAFRRVPGHARARRDATCRYCRTRTTAWMRCGRRSPKRSRCRVTRKSPASHVTSSGRAWHRWRRTTSASCPRRSFPERDAIAPRRFPGDFAPRVDGNQAQLVASRREVAYRHHRQYAGQSGLRIVAGIE